MPTNLFTIRAAIEEPAGDADALVGSWEVADDWGYASRGFALEGSSLGQIQVGNEIEITAGYDANRVHLMRGWITEVAEALTPNNVSYRASGQDQGTREILSTPITFAWEARPPSVLPRAHTILREAAAQVGVTVGTLGFPDYGLHASYVAHRRKLLEIVSDLTECWNQFGQIQHVPIVRDKVLSVLRVDWANPPGSGHLVPRSHLGSRQRTQRSYDDEPRLSTVTDLVVRGAAYLQERPNLGVERRYHYAQRQVNHEILESFAGTYGDFVWLEIYSLEEREEGKVTRTHENHYQTTLDAAGVPGAATLVRRITVDYSYYVPTQAIQQLVAFEPITLKNALCWATLEVHEGVDETTAVFGPQTRSFKQFFYDSNGQEYAEEETAQEYDSTAGAWKPARVTTRTHAQTTASTVRTQLTSYTVDPDNNNHLTFDQQDSQQVGGQLPTANSMTGRDESVSVQVQFPALDLVNGVPTERRRSSNAWVYENAYIGPTEARQIYDLARQEQALQLTPVRWEEVSFESTLDPNLWVGQPVRIEIDAGTYRDYWVESVHHQCNINGARTTGVAKRLTESVVVEPTVVSSSLVAPTNLVAAAVSPTEIDLQWDDNAANESSYRIERSLDGVTGWNQITVVAADTTSYADTGLTATTHYYYRVRAFSISLGAFSGYSNVADDTTFLVAPTTLTATAISSSQIDLAWVDNSGNEDGFAIERSANGLTGWSQIATVGANITVYSNTGLTGSTTYYYRVRAFKT